MKDHRLSFNSVQIIESLRPGDYPTGLLLYEDLEPLGIALQPSISTQFTQVETKAEFLDLLKSIGENSKRTGDSPIIHIEVHGSDQGIQVTSGECLSWFEFKDELTAINEASRLNLLVLLAACDGVHLFHIIQPTDRAPFYAMIGPNRDVSEGELLAGVTTFYKTLFESNDAVIAWRAMNKAVSSEKRTFSVFTAEFTFQYVMHKYLKLLCSEEALDSRENEAVSKAARNGMAEHQLAHFRKWFRKYIREHRAHFEARRSHFFFYDLFPENATRFDLTFEECVAEPSMD